MLYSKSKFSKECTLNLNCKKKLKLGFCCLVSNIISTSLAASWCPKPKVVYHPRRQQKLDILGSLFCLSGCFFKDNLKKDLKLAEEKHLLQPACDQIDDQAQSYFRQQGLACNFAKEIETSLQSVKSTDAFQEGSYISST